MSWILIPSLCAFLLKLYVLNTTRSEGWAGHSWISLVLVLAALNLTELIAYSGYLSDLAQTHMVKAYYVCAVVTMAFCLLYVVDESTVQTVMSKVILALSAVISAAIMLGDQIVGPYVANSIPIVAEKGQWFSIISLYFLVSSSLTFIVLWFNYRNSNDASEKIAYAYTIVALLPFMLTCAVVLVLKAAGINANGSMFIPLATTAFLMITAMGKDSSQIERDPRNLISPNSAQARASREMSRITTQYALNNISYKDAMDLMATEFVEMTLEENGGNISKAATTMGVARSLIYRRRRGADSVDASPVDAKPV